MQMKAEVSRPRRKVRATSKPSPSGGGLEQVLLRPCWHLDLGPPATRAVERSGPVLEALRGWHWVRADPRNKQTPWDRKGGKSILRSSVGLRYF